MKNFLRFTFLLFFIISGYGYSLSQETAKTVKPVILFAGDVKIFPLNTPTRIVIENPNVVDVTSVSKDEIVVTAKGAGTTNLVYWDDSGEHLLRLQVFLEDMSPVKERIDGILKELNVADVYTHRADSEGKVLLLGTVKAAEDLERIETSLAALKGKTLNLIQLKEERASIEIDTMVLELNKDATKTLGFTWPGAVNLIEEGSPGIAAAGTKWSTLFKVLNLQRGTSAGADPFTFKLDALIQEGKARILSRPRLVCQSGKEAELLVGGEKPVLTTVLSQTGGGQGTNVEYKEFGIKLKIRPKLAQDGKIQLALNVEVSDVGTAETLGSSTSPTAKAYPLSKRNTSTQVYLNDGQSLAISGLIKQKTQEDLRKFPWLGDVPILGLFFRKETTNKGGGSGALGDTELVVTLTPRIIKENVSKTETKAEVAFPPAKKEEAAKEKTKKKEIKLGTPDFSGYIRDINQRINNNFVYPSMAKKSKMEGSLKLGLRIHRTGRLLGVELKKSSGFGVLDENAIKIVKDSAPYPPFPPGINQEELQIDLPVIYEIK